MISLSAVIGIAFLALIVYLLLAALDSDSDYYDSVRIPSENQPIELPKGETDLYLAVAGDPEELGDINVPDDLSITVQSADGEVARTEDRSGETEKTDDGVTTLVGATVTPEEGTYFVFVETEAATGSPELSLTFGLSPLGAVKERFEDVVDELNGPTGIAVLAALGLLLMAPRISRAVKR